ncbi:MAG: hypothetical protein AB7P99_16960 [Vicinamibacterales bacterium]
MALDLRRAVREGAAGIERRQKKRLADLVAHARANSPFYQQLYGDLRRLTDRTITRAELEAFVADPSHVGVPFRPPGVVRSQLVQVGPAALSLRLSTVPGADIEAVSREVIAKFASFFATQGLGNVELVRAAEPPEQRPGGGKFRHVIARPAGEADFASGPRD